MKNLTEIFNKCGSDKGTHAIWGWENKHLNYTEVYENYFNKWRLNNINFLEIGIHDPRFPGASISAWTEYFPNANFYGYDIVDCIKFEKPRVKTFKGDQNSKDDLNRFIKEAACEFDIVVDDGSHILEHVLTTFTYIFPKLKNGGYYFIEDLMVMDLRVLLSFLDDNKEKMGIKNYTLFNNNWLILIEKHE